MAIAFVTSAQASSSGSPTSLGVTVTLTGGSGHSFIVVVEFSPLSGTATASVADTHSNSYGTADLLSSPASSADDNLAVFHCDSGTGGSTTITATFSAGCFSQIHVLEFSGMATSASIDQKTIASDATANVTVTSPGATAQASEAAVAVYSQATNDGGTATPSTGWTKDGTSGITDTLGVAYQILSSVSTPSCSWTNPSASVGHKALATFKGAGGGPAFIAPLPKVIRQAVNRASTY